MWKYKNCHKLHFLGRKLNLNRKLPGGVDGKTCHLALRSFLSQLFHLRQRTGIILIHGIVHSMLLWLLVLEELTGEQKSSVFLPMGLRCKRECGIPVSVRIWQGNKPWALSLEVSCQFKLLPADNHLQAAQPTGQNNKNVFCFSLNSFL